MIRLVAQHSDRLFQIVGSLPAEQCPFLLSVGQTVFQRAEMYPTYVLYRRAVEEKEKEKVV
jgi:hypothetical protein